MMGCDGMECDGLEERERRKEGRNECFQKVILNIYFVRSMNGFN